MLDENLKGRKMKKLMFVLLSMMVLAVTLHAAEKQIPKADQAGAKTYGSAVVDKVLTVENDFVLRCDVKGWPAIIGSDIPVRVGSIAPPKIVTTEGRPNSFFQMQTRKFIEKRLAKAEVIELTNITRGETFSIVADIIVDANSLSTILINEGLARKLQPGEKIVIVKKDSTSTNDGTANTKNTPAADTAGYVASKSSKIFHRANCRSAKSISDKNKIIFTTQQQAISTGRRPCKACNP